MNRNPANSFRDFQQRYPPNNYYYGNQAAAQQPVSRPSYNQPPRSQQPANNYYAEPQAPTRRQTMTRQQQQQQQPSMQSYSPPQPSSQRMSQQQQAPVRRISSVNDAAYSVQQQQRRPVNNNQWPPAQVVMDDDSDFEQEQDFRSSIRSAPRQVSAFKSAEASLCLVPQTPSVMEIAKLLKGEKGEQGTPGDSYFEFLPEDTTTIRLRQAENLRITGKLSVDQIEVRNPRGVQLLAAGEGVTGEEGVVTIQLSRELKNTWNASNAKVVLTQRQLGGQLFIPLNGFDAEANQFSIHCSEKQRMAFDWFFYRI